MHVCEDPEVILNGRLVELPDLCGAAVLTQDSQEALVPEVRLS